MATDVAKTYTANEDGTITVKDGDKEVRYSKESDLLALKGSREAAERKAKDAEGAKETAVEAAKREAQTAIEAEHQKVLQAEAQVKSLEEKITQGGNTAEELKQLKVELATAKQSGEEQGNKLLTMKRTYIVSTYGVPIATVEKKDMKALETFEEALKEVVGQKLGNYAAGGGGGGSGLEGKSPMELATMAYSSSNKK